MSPAAMAGMVALGALAGLTSAFFGVGGGWLVTPILLLSGLPAPLAVGTSLAFVAGTGAVGVARHAPRGRIPWGHTGWLAAGAVAGIEAGRRLLVFLESRGVASAVVAWVLVAVMAGTGQKLARGGGRRRRGECESKAAGGPPPAPWLLPVGAAIGTVSGVAGIGGGILLVPVLTTLFAMDHRAAVGASLASVGAAGAWRAFAYGLGGEVAWMSAACLIAGAALGAEVGARACHAAQADRFRRLFGFQMCAAAVFLALDRTGWRRVALVGLLACAAGISALILWAPSVKTRNGDECA